MTDVQDKPVCVEPPSSAVSTMLPAFAAERRRPQHGACSTAPAARRPQLAIDIICLQALSSKPAGRRCCCRSMGQTDETDKRTPERCIDRAPHTAGSVDKLINIELVIKWWCCVHMSGIGGFPFRKESVARIPSMTVEAPITKVGRRT